MRGEGPGCSAPNANNGGHVTAAREAAVATGTCSLRGGGPNGGRAASRLRRGGRARLRGRRVQRFAPAVALRAHRWSFLREGVQKHHLYLKLDPRGADGLLMRTSAAPGPVRAQEGWLPVCAGLPRSPSRDTALGQPRPRAGRQALLKVFDTSR